MLHIFHLRILFAHEKTIPAADVGRDKKLCQGQKRIVWMGFFCYNKNIRNVSCRLRQIVLQKSMGIEGGDYIGRWE